MLLWFSTDSAAFDSKLGQFAASGGSSTLGWILVWPLEVLKNQVQAGTVIHGNAKYVSPTPGAPSERCSPGLGERARYMMHAHGGVAGLYRGIIPGTLRAFIANGTSMIVMQWAQKKVSEWGLRTPPPKAPDEAIPHHEESP